MSLSLRITSKFVYNLIRQTEYQKIIFIMKIPVTQITQILVRNKNIKAISSLSKFEALRHIWILCQNIWLNVVYICIYFIFIGCLSTQEAIERRHHLFTLEKKRQVEQVGRIEKIEVKYKGIPKDCTLVMNKDISTPYDCARRKYIYI